VERKSPTFNRKITSITPIHDAKFSKKERKGQQDKQTKTRVQIQKKQKESGF